MTPLQVELLLHIYACKGKIPNVECSAQSEALSLFEEDELIRPDPHDPLNQHGWRLASRGKALVSKILSLNPPEAEWIFEPHPKVGE